MAEQRMECVTGEHMEHLLHQFASLDRLSGSKGAEEAVRVILDQLNSWGICCYNLEFESYVSDPLDSRLVIRGQGERMLIASRPRSFCSSCPEGIQGQIWYDAEGTVTGLKNRYRALVKDKIVLSFNYDEDYAKAVSDLGGKGLIQIWRSDEDVIHEDTVGCVWGTPTPLTKPMLPQIPVVGITLQSGKNLLDLLRKDEVEAKITTELFYGVKKLQLPVAVIPGKTDDFVLLSGHYDSWYYGVTDNATGNALCLEVARVFQEHRDQLEKGLVVAWWPGHSNGRYSGSTWFCDRYWRELNQHCFGHINIDSPGCKGAEQVVLGTTLFEGIGFLRRHTQNQLGREPKAYSQLFKGADQSFFGCGLPIHIYPMFKQAEGNKIYASPGSGGGWWWHTPEDTSDYADLNLLVRDTKYIVSMLEEMLCEPVIPVDGKQYFGYIKNVFLTYEKESPEEFDFTEILRQLEELTRTFEKALEVLKDDAAGKNRLYKCVGGEMNRLMNSYSDRFEFDFAMPAALFPGVGIVKGIQKEEMLPEEYLFVKTQFVRQKNRLVYEMGRLIRDVEELIKAAQEGEKKCIDTY